MSKELGNPFNVDLKKLTFEGLNNLLSFNSSMLLFTNGHFDFSPDPYDFEGNGNNESRELKENLNNCYAHFSEQIYREIKSRNLTAEQRVTLVDQVTDVDDPFLEQFVDWAYDAEVSH